MHDSTPRRRLTVGFLALVMGVAVGAAGCSKNSSTTSTGGTTTSAGAGTSVSTTPPAVPSGTKPAPADTAVTTSTLARPSTPLTISQSTDGTSPNGSGCTPPPGDALPDGIWFGFTKGVDTTKPTLTLDLACFYTGPAATKAAGRTPDDPIENDYFIKNENPKLYTLPLAEDVEVLRLQNNGNTAEYEPTTTGPGEAADAAKAFSDYFLTWIAISGGKVVVVQQQFVP